MGSISYFGPNNPMIEIRMEKDSAVLSKAISQILDEYGNSVRGEMDAALDLMADNVRLALSNNSPRHKLVKVSSYTRKYTRLQNRGVFSQNMRIPGTYARGWAVRKMVLADESIRKIYNKTSAGLTHLLEYGHRSVSKYGRITGSGWVPPKPHIFNTFDWVISHEIETFKLTFGGK